MTPLPETAAPARVPNSTGHVAWKSMIAGVVLCLSAAACTPAAHADATRAVAAPEFAGIARWFNTQPLSMAGLRGKVVLVEFWTYSCINCLHVAPHVKQWHERYRDQGLVVIGVHTPEYDEEHSAGNVQTAIKRLGIDYPVAQDNDYATWNAYGNRFWPALYLIDRDGRIVYRHYGEGEYDVTDARIRALLALR